MAAVCFSQCKHLHHLYGCRFWNKQTFSSKVLCQFNSVIRMKTCVYSQYLTSPIYSGTVHLKSGIRSRQRHLTNLIPSGSTLSARNRIFSSSDESQPSDSDQLPLPEFNWDYLCDKKNTQAIQENIDQRKGVGNIKDLLEVWSEIEDISRLNQADPYLESATSSGMVVEDYLQAQEEDLEGLWQRLYELASDIPNTTHSDVPVGDESQAILIETCGNKRDFQFNPKGVVELGQNLGILRTDHVGQTTGNRTYYFLGALAQLEEALIQFTLSRILEKGYSLVSVPDLIHPGVIEGCGFKTRGNRTQIYKLEPSKHGDVCLAGTGEMALAGLHVDSKLHPGELPKRLCTVSRCYRAETSDVEEERGIYRVHQFTKVEMFGVTASSTGDESEELMSEILEIQKELYSDLNLHFRVLDMPTQELGAPAYRKYDIEAWMPAGQFWGEISSASNCTDYQSTRLNIKYWDDEGNVKHCHTVNGTACAIPRVIMTILENNQEEDGTVTLPDVLWPYMDGMQVIKKPPDSENLKWINSTKKYRKQTR